jgi:hypothetical protein
MKRAATLVLALLGTILTAGCPYQSDVPLGNPGPGSLDPQLLGHWVAAESDGSPVEIDFMPFNEGEYLVELREKDRKPDHYRAFTVRVGGEAFLNVADVNLDAARRPFHFARYSIGPNGALALLFVGDGAVPKELGTDQKKLQAFVAAHLEGTFLNDSEKASTLHRPGASPASPVPGPAAPPLTR